MLPDVIYNFSVEAKTSTIPHAGNGAFLTFLGARELKPSIKKRNESYLRKRENIVSCHLSEEANLLYEPLTCRFENDRMASVSLKGEHLHTPHNCWYLVADSVDPETGSAIPDFNRHYTVEELDGMDNQANRIGRLKVNKVSDYIPAPNRTFSSLHKSCGLIDLARYGPYQKQGKCFG